MPGEPKRRHSKARKRTRRASINLKGAGFVVCSNCRQPTLPHQVCKNCGFYGGKQVKVKMAVKITKA